MASSIRSPPTRAERQKASPWSEITPTSVVPPPMSTTIDPIGSATGSPAPVGAGISHRVANRAAFDRRRARGNTDHHFGPAREATRAAVRLADEMLDHLLGDLEVGDDAGAKRPDGPEVVGCLAEHQFGVVAHGMDPALAAPSLDGDYRRLAGDDPRAADVNDGIRGTEIDRDSARRETERTHL